MSGCFSPKSSCQPVSGKSCACDTAAVDQIVASPDAFACPIQILVIDSPNGAATILIDTISLLLNREISVTSVESHADVFRALEYYTFDLVVVGLQADRPAQLTILPWLHDDNPDRPILVVGRNLPRQYRQYARAYGARDVLNMPERAAELKILVRHMAERYLDPAMNRSLAQAS
jgi:DNA-binding NtrC family response regulator